MPTLAAPPEQASSDPTSVVAELAEALRRDDVATLTALGAPGGITAPEWARKLRWLVDTFDRFEIDRCAVVEDREGENGARLLVVELVATASPMMRPESRRPLPRWWSLEIVPTPAGWKIRSAMAREDRLALVLLAADQPAREAAFALPFVDASALLRAFAYSGDGEGGIAVSQWVVAVARRRGDLHREATGLRMVAAGEMTLGRHDDALVHAQQALLVARRAKVPSEIAGALFTTGITHWFRNDHTAAVDALLAAGDAATGEDDPWQGFQALFMAARIEEGHGRLREALQILEEIRRRLRRWPLARAVIDNDFLLAEVYGQLGEDALARHAFQRAYDAARALGDDGLAGMALANLNATESDPVALRRSLDELLRTPAATKMPRFAVNARLGAVLRRRGDRAGAEEAIEESLRLARDVDERRATAAALAALGELRLEQRRAEEALALAAEGCALAEGPESGTRTVSSSAPWRPRTIEGRALRALGRRDDAARSFAIAIEQLENRETSLPDDALSRASFFDENTAPYRELADLQVDAGDPAGALATAERMRARALRDVLAAGRVDLSATLDEPERAEEARLDARVRELNRSILQASDERERQRLASEREAARLDLQSYTTRLYAAHPRLRQRRAGFAETLDWRASVPPGALAVEYLVGARRTLLFVVGRRPDGDAFVEAVPIEIEQRELERRVKTLAEAVAGNDPSFAAEARALHTLLLGPVERHLAGVDRLCVVPDGILWDVPFPALIAADGSRLADTVASFRVPSLRTVAADRPSSRPERFRILALGNPTVPSPAARARAKERGIDLGPLPEAEREVREIARLYGRRRGEVWVKGAAAEARFKAAAARYQILHVATHGLLDDRTPMFSALLLAAPADAGGEDGLLEAREIADLRLDADLVVLSACETGRGKIGGGEGVIGLSWAFLAAGVPTLVVSNWKTDSAATAKLMVRFHRELLAGHGAAEALRRAELALARDPLYAHPYYWAAFTVVGQGW